MITVPAAVTTALASGQFSYALLIELPGSGTGTRRITTHWDDLSYGGFNYLPGYESVELVNVDGVKRQLEVGSDSLQLTFDNASTTLYAEYVATNHVGKPVTVTALFLDDAGDPLTADSGMQLFHGLVDSWGSQESGSKSVFTIKLTSHWSAWKVNKGRYTNSESQEEVYAGDTFFEFAHQEELPIKWGL